MKSTRKKLRSFVLKHFDQLERWRWVVIGFIGLGLFTIEVYEHIELSFLNQPMQIGEVFLYATLLICTGLFLELFVRLNRVHQRTLKILEYKHNLSLELTMANDWNSLTARLAELPSRIAQVDEAYLMVSNLISNKFETLSHWIDRQQAQPIEKWDAHVPCKKCGGKANGNNARIHLCRADNDASSYFAYCLSIIDKNFPSILLKFRLKPGLELSPDEEQILLNVSDEIVVSLRAGQEHKRLSEFQSTEIAMAERRLVSAYVHDQLGQNLGYLHLKLDQLSTNEDIINSREVRKDMKYLREVANESYEIVRDILKKMQPETIPHLTNLLKEHAVKVSHAAGFHA